MRVSDGSAMGTYGMIRKQLLGVGCPVWPEGHKRSEPDEESSEEAFASFGGSLHQFLLDQAAVPARDTIRLWCLTYDDGPDMRRFRKLVKTTSRC
eukprot:2691684-Pyramimonas_sp.AAC.1